MSAQIETRLHDLQLGLEGLLSCFETGTFPQQDAMDAAWSRVLRGFEDVRAEIDQRGNAVREEDRQGLTECLRLYAVATGVLARRREELAGERSLHSRARQHLCSLGDAQGDSCDLRA